MQNLVLTIAIVVPAAIVVIAIIAVLWRERTSERTSRVAAITGVVLAAWLTIVVVLAVRDLFLPPDAQSPPPVGIALAIVMIGMAVMLALSPSLRALLTNQKNVIRLNVWRLLGIVFLMLMWNKQVPPLWALPTGIGDIIVGAAAFWVAGRVDAPGGKSLAIAFNLFGMLDLIVAIALGIMTNPGVGHVFDTTPTNELMTHFPMVVVPTFLVPLAFMLHVVSLWQLLGGSWVRRTDAVLG